MEPITKLFGLGSVWDDSNTAYYGRMADALEAGDEEAYSELMSYVTGKKGINEKTSSKGVVTTKEEVVQSKVKAEIKARYTEQGLTAADAERMLVTGGACKNADEAKLLVANWQKASSSGYTLIDNAMAAGTGVKDEVARYARQHVTETTTEQEAMNNATAYVKRSVLQQLTDGVITESEAKQRLSDWCGIDNAAQDLYTAKDKKAFAESGMDGEYRTYWAMEQLIDSQMAGTVKAGEAKRVVTGYVNDAGKKPETVKSQVTKAYKQAYKECKSRAEQQRVINYALEAYRNLGYNMKEADVRKSFEK